MRKHLFAVIAHLPTAVLAQEPTTPVQLFCLHDDASVEAGEIVRPLDALKAVNTILDKGGMLTIAGTTGQFFDAWLAGPDFTVRANHNEAVILDRGLLMEGGPGCKAWLQGPGREPDCPWSIVSLPSVDLEAEPRETAFMVWETLILTGNELRLIRVLSGGRELSVQSYSCDDPEDLLRYMRAAE